MVIISPKRKPVNVPHCLTYLYYLNTYSVVNYCFQFVRCYVPGRLFLCVFPPPVLCTSPPFYILSKGYTSTFHHVGKTVSDTLGYQIIASPLLVLFPLLVDQTVRAFCLCFVSKDIFRYRPSFVIFYFIWQHCHPLKKHVLAFLHDEH